MRWLKSQFLSLSNYGYAKSVVDLLNDKHACLYLRYYCSQGSHITTLGFSKISENAQAWHFFEPHYGDFIFYEKKHLITFLKDYGCVLRDIVYKKKLKYETINPKLYDERGMDDNI